jgi:hypothetical protein
MKPILRGTHIHDRMRERRISREQLQLVIDAPDSATYDTQMVSIRLERQVGSRILKVWVRAPWPPAGDEVEVKSAAWKGRK